MPNPWDNFFPGDWLLYRKPLDWMARVIQWAEWVDGSESQQYFHSAMFYGGRTDAPGLWIVRQNPGGPAFERVEDQPWDGIDGYALTLAVWGSEKNLPLPDRPGSELAFRDAFRGRVAAHWGDGYGYAEIADYLGEDLLARIGQSGAADELRQKSAAFLSRHQEVCSEFCRIVCTQALVQQYLLPGLNLFPALGPGQCRPADARKSPFLRQIAD